MKRLLLLFVSAVLLSACSGVKKTQQALNRGDYTEATANAIEKLQKNKTKKNNQPYIVLLEEAFSKTTKEAKRNMAFLEKDDNPSNLEKIYETYVGLDELQENIKPLLPLYIEDKNRKAKFNFNNYDAEILEAKDQLSNYLYDSSSKALNLTQTKSDFRNIYRDLDYLNQINPNFKDVNLLLDEAHNKGTNYIYVEMDNQTNVIIPRRLESDLLNFNTYNLDDFWTVYHNAQVPDWTYDYTMAIQLRDINISPEQIRERIVEKEKEVKDGWKYRVDRRGNYVLDDNGDKIKDDVYKVVNCTFYEFIQNKSTEVSGTVTFINNKTQQTTDSFPLASAFVFEHSYADYEGDKRALDNKLARLLNDQAVPFPSNEQMVYDTGENLKENIKSIVKQKRFELGN